MEGIHVRHENEQFRKSFSEIGWAKEEIIPLTHHSYVTTGLERIKNAKHWELKFNQDSAQQPLNQRPDFAQTGT